VVTRILLLRKLSHVERGLPPQDPYIEVVDQLEGQRDHR
jgi:hypothetical protein